MATQRAIRGVSSLGIAHPRYPIDRLLWVFERRPTVCITWLLRYFNKLDNSNVERVLKEDKHTIINAKILNGPGINGFSGRPEKHELTFGYNPKELNAAILRGRRSLINGYRDECKKVADVCSILPERKLELFVSPILEMLGISIEAFDVLAQVTKEELPMATVVYNHVYNKPSDRYLWEAHGEKTKAPIVDLDGVDYSKVKLRTFGNMHKFAKLLFIWGYSDNGRGPGGRWVNSSRRTKFAKDDRKKWKLYRDWVEHRI